MQRITLQNILWTSAGLFVAIACIWTLWSYIFSFQTVTFHFDDKLGYIELHSEGQPTYYPADNQPVKLKKGTYRIKNIGAHIVPSMHNQVVDSSTSDVTVRFDYTRQYLDSLYAKEQAAIEAALLADYPRIAMDYRIVHSKLYHQGELYGAILIAQDQGSDNADTLRVLMQKKNGAWKLLSRPPTPILSAPLYPSVDRVILLDINQAK